MPSLEGTEVEARDLRVGDFLPWLDLGATITGVKVGSMFVQVDVGEHGTADRDGRDTSYQFHFYLDSLVMVDRS
jgi:hypothetical protein